MRLAVEAHPKAARAGRPDTCRRAGRTRDSVGRARPLPRSVRGEAVQADTSG